MAKISTHKSQAMCHHVHVQSGLIKIRGTGLSKGSQLEDLASRREGEATSSSIAPHIFVLFQ